MAHCSKLLHVARGTLLALTLAGLGREVLAWGQLGHHAMGSLASHLLPLSSTTHSQLVVLLGDEAGSDLGIVSSWADQIKRRPRYRNTAPLHYSDSHDSPPSSCSYSMARDCPDGRCLTQAIREFARLASGLGNDTDFHVLVHGHGGEKDIKKSRKRHRGRRGRGRRGRRRRHRGKHHRPDEKPSPPPPSLPEDPLARRAKAIKFLVHFVQDLHQPLHLSGRDRGGNEARAIFSTDEDDTQSNNFLDHPLIQPYTAERSTNLHTIWDSLMLEKFTRHLRNISLVPAHVEISDTDLLANYLLNKIKSGWSNETTEWLSCNALSKPQYQYHSQHTPPHLSPTQISFSINDVTNTTTSLLDCIPEWTTKIEVLNCETVWPGYVSGADLGGDYYRANIPIALKLMAIGSVRLAAILKETLL